MIPTIQLFNMHITSSSCPPPPFFFGETSFCLIECVLFHSGYKPYGALPEMFIDQVTALCPKPTWKYHLALKASLL